MTDFTTQLIYETCVLMLFVGIACWLFCKFLDEVQPNAAEEARKSARKALRRANFCLFKNRVRRVLRLWRKT